MRRRKFNREAFNREAPLAWKYAVMARTEGLCAQCGASADHAHHIVTQQKCRDKARELGVEADWLVYDQRNGLALCERCHARHHSRQAPLPAGLLPDSVWSFSADYGFGVFLERTYPAETERGGQREQIVTVPGDGSSPRLTNGVQPRSVSAGESAAA